MVDFELLQKPKERWNVAKDPDKKRYTTPCSNVV